MVLRAVLPVFCIKEIFGLSIRAVLQKSVVFQGLSESDYARLEAGCRFRSLEPNSNVDLDTATLFVEGTYASEMYLVDRGEIAIESLVETPKGEGDDEEYRQTIIQHAVRTEGDLVGEFALLDREPRSADARATQPSRVLTIGESAFLKTLENSPKLAHNLIRYLVSKLRASTSKRALFAQKVRDRLGAELREEADRNGLFVERQGTWLRKSDGWRVVQQPEWAARVACTREVINRTLKDLVQLGEIERKGDELLIRSRTRVAAVARAIRRAARSAGSYEAGFVLKRDHAHFPTPERISTTPALLEDAFRELGNRGALAISETEIRIRDTALLDRLANDENRIIQQPEDE